MNIRSTTLVLFSLLVHLGFSQWGGRAFQEYSYLPESSSSADNGFRFGQGLGVDFFTGDRNSVGLDYLSFSKRAVYYSNGSSDYYSGQSTTSGFVLRSNYAFTSVEYAHGYLSSKIGLIRTKAVLDRYNNAFVSVADFTQSSTVIPIGLNIGYRGSNDGFFGDIWFGMSCQISVSSNSLPASYSGSREESILFINAGYALGFCKTN